MSNANSRIVTGSSSHRVVVYVDGLNLYYGLKSAGFRRYYWLDLWRLAQSMLRRGQSLAAVKYFTAKFAPDPADPGRHIRQDAYLQALDTLPDLSIQYGYHLPKARGCPQCGATISTYEEKMTDVNIAVALLNDAQDNLFDTAIVISADSDLSGPISSVRSRYANKPILVAFPPKRASKELRRVASGSFHIGRDVLRRNQLPDPVVKPDGMPLPNLCGGPATFPNAMPTSLNHQPRAAR